MRIFPQEEQRDLRKLFDATTLSGGRGQFSVPGCGRYAGALHAKASRWAGDQQTDAVVAPLWKRWISRNISPWSSAAMTCRTKAASGTAAAGGRKIILAPRAAVRWRFAQ
jgi:hypothetical protein